jgi:hypothetical protein
MPKESVDQGGIRRSYAGFGPALSFRQVVHSLRSKRAADQRVAYLRKQLRRDEERISRKLGSPLQGLDILEVGPGQSMGRARYLGLNNNITTIDLDYFPNGRNPLSSLRIIKINSVGRFAKTLGRKMLLVDRANRIA